MQTASGTGLELATALRTGFIYGTGVSVFFADEERTHGEIFAVAQAIVVCFGARNQAQNTGAPLPAPSQNILAGCD